MRNDDDADEDNGEGDANGEDDAVPCEECCAALAAPHQGHIQVQIKSEYPDTNTTNFPDPLTGYGYEYHKFPGPDNRIRILKRIRSDQISTKKASEYFGYPKKNLKPGGEV